MRTLADIAKEISDAKTDEYMRIGTRYAQEPGKIAEEVSKIQETVIAEALKTLELQREWDKNGKVREKQLTDTLKAQAVAAAEVLSMELSTGLLAHPSVGRIFITLTKEDGKMSKPIVSLRASKLETA